MSDHQNHQNSDIVLHADFQKCRDQQKSTSSLRAQRPRKKQTSYTTGLPSPNGQTASSAPAPAPAPSSAPAPAPAPKNSPIPSTEFKVPFAPSYIACAKKLQKSPSYASKEKTDGSKTRFDSKVTRLDHVLEKIQNINRQVESRGIDADKQQHLPLNIKFFYPMINQQNAQQRKNSNNEQINAEVSRNRNLHTPKNRTVFHCDQNLPLCTNLTSQMSQNLGQYRSRRNSDSSNNSCNSDPINEMGSECKEAHSGLQHNLSHQTSREFCFPISNSSHRTGTILADGQSTGHNEAKAVASDMHVRSFRQSKAAAVQTAAIREKMQDISAHVEIIGVGTTDSVLRPNFLSIQPCTENHARHMPAIPTMAINLSTPQGRRQLMQWQKRRDICSPIVTIYAGLSPCAYGCSRVT